jgi:hypothetical protein
MRIGIIGTENSHVDHYVEVFNRAGRYDGFRVVALAGGDSDRNRHLAEAGGIAHIVGESAELLGLVDSAIVCSRDGRRHFGQARPLVAAGLPVFVDKPFTCDVAEAEGLAALAAAKGVPIMSGSILRWAPEIAELDNRCGASPQSLLLVRGPASPASEYAGLWFYGIHVVEAAMALLHDRTIGDISVSATGGSVFAHGIADGTEVLLEFVEPGPGPATWTVGVAGPDGLATRWISSTAAAADRAVDEYVQMLRTGRAPLSDTALVAPVSVLQAITS